MLLKVLWKPSPFRLRTCVTKSDKHQTARTMASSKSSLRERTRTVEYLCTVKKYKVPDCSSLCCPWVSAALDHQWLMCIYLSISHTPHGIAPARCDRSKKQRNEAGRKAELRVKTGSDEAQTNHPRPKISLNKPQILQSQTTSIVTNAV